MVSDSSRCDPISFGIQVHAIEIQRVWIAVEDLTQEQELAILLRAPLRLLVNGNEAVRRVCPGKRSVGGIAGHDVGNRRFVEGMEDHHARPRNHLKKYEREE